MLKSSSWPRMLAASLAFVALLGSAAVGAAAADASAFAAPSRPSTGPCCRSSRARAPT